MTDESAAAMRHVVAALTAISIGGPVEATRFLATLTTGERADMADCAIGMLAHEIELGCADASIDMAEYLSLLGRSLA